MTTVTLDRGYSVLSMFVVKIGVAVALSVIGMTWSAEDAIRNGGPNLANWGSFGLSVAGVILAFLAYLDRRADRKERRREFDAQHIIDQAKAEKIKVVVIEDGKVISGDADA